AVKEREVRYHRGDCHPVAQPVSSDERGRIRKISGLPLLPIAERCQRGKCGQKVSRDRKRHDQRQSARIAALWILNLFGYGGQLFVSGIQPKSQGQAHAKNFFERLVGRNHWDKWVVLPLRQ